MNASTKHVGALALQAFFEKLVWASFLLSLLQGSLQLLPSLDVNGWTISLTKLFFSPVVSLLLALAISRLRSRIAAVVFMLSVLAALWLAYLDLVEEYWNNIPFAIGAVSIFCDLIAAFIVGKWLVRREI